MRRVIKEQILQLLLTLQEAHNEIAAYWQKFEIGTVRSLLADCQDGAVSVGNTLEQFDEGEQSRISSLEKYCERLFEVNNALEKSDLNMQKDIVADLNAQIQSLYEEIKANIKVKLKIAFMPYKASMWTSLESIWKAAQADAECEAKVVVIPYYTLDSMQRKSDLVYEADLFPSYVPVTPYSRYDLAKEQPDMIFIHNPYDNTNNVTRVPEQYYSYNLKKYTKQLIYSPYGMMGYYNPNQSAFMCCTNAVIVSDKILVQSERVKQIYTEHGVNQSKLMALGSPKVDAVVESLKQSPVYPQGWEERLKGRKVFLLNTHLLYFIKGQDYAKKNPGRNDYAKWIHEQIFDQLLNKDGCALIWRPHPLLKTALESRNLYDSLMFVEELEQRIKESNNAVLDQNGGYDISFRLSDALVTTYSSLMPEYMISGKPVYIYQHRLNSDNCRQSPVDYSNNYYRAKTGEEPQFPKFVGMVLNGEDFLYEQRMSDVHRAFSNLEGTIGKNIYQELKTEWQTW
ncbi:MAG: CDP-glycerol glycerophosphotransferase family protein [Butyrivibrio sp.]